MKVSRVLKIIFLTILTIVLVATALMPSMIIFSQYFSYTFFLLLIIMFDISAIVEKRILKEPPELFSTKNLPLSWIPFFSLIFVFAIFAKLSEMTSLPVEVISPLLESFALFSGSVLVAIQNRSSAIAQKSIRLWVIGSVVYVSLTIPYLIIAILSLFGFKYMSPRIEDFSFEVAFTGFLLLILIERRHYFLSSNKLESDKMRD
jgi:hypothetical protein